MKTLIRIFSHNLHLKLTAVGLAVILWAVVLVKTNPWTVREFDATVKATGVAGELQVMSTEPATVKVALAGRRSNVERVAGKALRAYGSVSGLDVGEHEVPVTLATGELPRGVEVVAFNSRTVRVSLDRTVRQKRAVLPQFRGRTASGFGATPGRPRPNEVTVSGPQSLVQAVNSVVAVVDYSGVQSTRTFTSRLEARDARGMPQEGVAIDPPTVQIEVVVEPINVKTVPVLLSLRTPAGRRLQSADVSPPTVTITGTPAVLHPIQFVRTKMVRATEDGVLPTVGLELPEGVTVVGDEPVVRVSVRFQPPPETRPRAPTPSPSGRGSAESGSEPPGPPTTHPPGEGEGGGTPAPPPPKDEPHEGGGTGNGSP